MSGEKTEQPSDKKLDDARKKGEAPKSPDVNAAVGLLTMTVCLALAGLFAGEHLIKLFAIVYERGVQLQTNAQVQALLFDILKEGLLTAAPFLAAAVAVALAASFSQVGVRISFDPVTPNFEHVNPASGLKRIVSLSSLVDLVKMLLKASLIGCVAFLICRSLVPMLVGASLQSPAGVVAVAWASLLKLLGAAAIVFAVIGPIDFTIQKWLFRRKQRMSKDDLKREYKEAEGDPLVKGQRRQMALEMMAEAAQTAVPRATVVVANPTHYAVALRYEAGRTLLPVVLAKGVDEQALEIRAIAEASRVPVVVNPPLARALHQLPVGKAIPESLFEAVAAVLRWVRTMKQITEPLGGSPEEGSS